MARGPLFADPGVLTDAPVCEFQGFGAAAIRGGHAVLPWRSAYRSALEQGVGASADSAALADGSFTQCLVHLQKSRAATWWDLAEAWRLLADGGRLLLAGSNALGVVSAVKRLGAELGQTPRILTNRSKARIVRFERGAGPPPTRPEFSTISLPVGASEERPLRVLPGAFGARRLDAGTALLLHELASLPAPRHLLDPGCGVGPLAIAALARWPAARATLLDADARAVASARHNLAAAGLAERARVTWWDAAEDYPTTGCDLALLNPPFHTGAAVDLGPARAMFRALAGALAPGGVALVVANRTLPYEADLAALGALTPLRAARGYKLLRVERRGSPGQRGRR